MQPVLSTQPSDNCHCVAPRRGRCRAALAAAALCCMQGSGWAADPAPVEQVVVKAVARFGFDGTTINEADRAAMLADVGKLKDVTWQTVTATGYTDSIGKPSYNERLSARRASAVKAYLVDNGLGPSMVRTRGLGEKQPVASNADEQGRALNRRAEIEFQGVRVPTK